MAPEYDIYHHLPGDLFVLGANCSFVPRSLHWGLENDRIPIPRLDGFWGLFEYSQNPFPYDPDYPYLAWIPLSGFGSFDFPTRVSTLHVQDAPSISPAQFCRHPSWPDRGYLNRDLYTLIRQDVYQLVEVVRGIIKGYDAYNRKRLAFSKLSSASNPFRDRSSTKFPLIAMQRACAASVALGLSDLLYRDVLEYLAGLKRAIAELQGFILWHHEQEARESSSIRRVITHRSRGVIVDTLSDYQTMERLGLPVWIVLEFTNPLALFPSKEVPLTDPPSNMGFWSAPGSTSSSADFYRGIFVHNKHLDYYPPVVDKSVSFERSARGYGPRLDVFKKDVRAIRDILSMVNAIRKRILCFIS